MDFNTKELPRVTLIGESRLWFPGSSSKDISLLESNVELEAYCCRVRQWSLSNSGGQGLADDATM